MPTSLEALRHYLLDLDGTIYLGEALLPGAARLVAGLQQSGRRHLFLTNNPTRDAAGYAAKLKKLGIDATGDDILTSGEATARYLSGKTPFRSAHVVGTPSFEAELRAAGINTGAEAPDMVVIAFDTTLTYSKLEQACHLLRRGLPYFATNPDRVCPTAEGGIPDCGAIAAFLEAATGRSPEYIGKPSAIMVAMALEKLGTDDASLCAMVGDRLYTDMEMAHRAGITSILVLSGEATAADLEVAEHKPAYVFDSVRGLAEILGL